jgi:hypothetical protein
MSINSLGDRLDSFVDFDYHHDSPEISPMYLKAQLNDSMDHNGD